MLENCPILILELRRVPLTEKSPIGMVFLEEEYRRHNQGSDVLSLFCVKTLGETSVIDTRDFGSSGW
jgi:hypothetical protein